LYFSARSAGLSPSGVFASMLAPISTSSLTTSLCPCAAARCRGVPAVHRGSARGTGKRVGKIQTVGEGGGTSAQFFCGNCWHTLTLVPAERLKGGLEFNQDLDCVSLPKLCLQSGSRIESHAGTVVASAELRMGKNVERGGRMNIGRPGLHSAEVSSPSPLTFPPLGTAYFPTSCDKRPGSPSLLRCGWCRVPTRPLALAFPSRLHPPT